MNTKKQAIIVWMPDNGGFHPMAWREEGTPANAETDFNVIREMVQTAERGKFHAVFLADALAVGFGPAPISAEVLSRTCKGARLEPLTLLSALATCTTNIGLIATASTTFAEPYNLARIFASIDYISNGRAGWNVVTSAHPKASLNFGVAELMAHDERYERSQEFFDIVTGLWDSWEDEAFLRDKASGRYFDPGKLHALNYEGRHLSSAGPLNISRPPQGHPVIAQAGSSNVGRAFAARNADVIYTMHAQMKLAKAFYDEVKDEVAADDRNPDHVKILPAMSLLLGRSQAHAEEKLARLDALVDPVVGMESLNGTVDFDFSSFPLDGPVPDVPETKGGSRTAQKYFLDMARRDNLTIRQFMQVTTRRGLIATTPMSIADTVQEWIEAGAADGFTFNFGDVTESLGIFVDEVIPELQRRGLFQTEYRGRTLRESLGIPRPVNRLAVPARV